MFQDEEVDFEAFAAAVETKEQKDAQDNQQKSGFEFPVCAQVGNKAIVRFVNGIAETATDRGKPGSGRAQLFNMGWVKDDDGKNFPICVPAIINNKPMYPSILLEFVDKVLSRTWIDNPDPTKKGSWKYFYAERDDRGALGDKIPGQLTLKDIFWNVFKSGHKEGEQYYESQKSWRGQTVYVANVIDRLDYKWHQENKKTKLLMRSLKLKGDQVRHKEISLFSIGAPLQELADNHGYKLDYDVLIVPGKASLDKFNLKNVSKLKEKEYWDDVKSVITDEDKEKISTVKGFTSEECTWDVVDISKYYRFTSATSILKHFGKTIQAFDDMVGTDFTERLKEEAALEKKEREAAKAAAGNAAPAPATETPSQPVTAPVQPAVAQPVEPSPVSAPVQTTSFDTMAKVETPTSSTDEDDDYNSFYKSLD